ncbi:hypothetical protein Ndes2526B_g06728 [Nannochloris sp. 'desiccata']
MSVLFRARVSSFLAGVAVMGVHATYQLKMHLVESQDLLVKEVTNTMAEMDKRVAKLELAVSTLASTDQQQ